MANQFDDVAVIQKETIFAIGDAIIDTTGRTEDFKVRDYPRLIREEVYGKGYSDGYSEAEASFSPMIYGTYMLRENALVPTLDDYVFFDFSVVDAFTYFYNGEDYEYRYIDNISLSDDGHVFITSDGGDYCTVFDGQNWYADGIGEFPDSRYKIIDVKTPLSVTQDSYDLFMGIVDCNTEETPYAVGESVGMVIGESAGRQQQYDEFWDAYQSFGYAMPYQYTSTGWNDRNFYPKHNIVASEVSSNIYGLFYAIGVTDLSQRIKDCGIIIDLSKGKNMGQLFAYAKITKIPRVSFESATSASGAFLECSKLVTIEGFVVHENLAYDSSTFNQCVNLENLIVEGTIGQNGLNLQWSNKLSKDSITSVMNALSDNTSGLSVAFSRTAVNNAYNQGVNSAQWQEWLHSKSNWTINLW